MPNKIISCVGEEIVVECENLPRLGQNILMDSDAGRVRIARVYDIIGTVESPFVVGKIFRENKKYIKSYEDLINKPVYLGDRPNRTRKGKEKGRQNQNPEKRRRKK